MSTKLPSGELAGLLEQLNVLAADTRKTFGGLSAEQLNWKPSADSWSVGQCFDHLIVTSQYFFPTLERITAGQRAISIWEKWSPLSSFFGRMIVGAMQPSAKRRFKAPARVRPSASAIGADVIEKFVESQRQLAERMRATANLDAEKIIVTSPIARFITYRLIDAYRIVVTHERRHFEQARRVMETEGFPQRVQGAKSGATL